MFNSPSAWSPEKIVTTDQRYVWHPYAPRSLAHPNIPVTSTRGTRLQLADGREVIDGMSSWWAAAHGHSHPHLVAAAHAQVDRMSHVMFGGLTHQPAAELASRLVSAVPGMDSVFFSDSGSVAVEVALKMAIQAQRGKTRFLTWRGGYHGDTRAPMSLCDPDTGMHSLWSTVLRPEIFVDAPPPAGSSPDVHARYLAHIEEALRVTHHDTVAAIIVEPIVQGAGGMRFHDPKILTGLRELCDRTGTLLIFDEIATGFGRTGTLFACEQAGVTPDILCLGKALTGGFMSFAATLTTQAVATAIDSPAGGGALMHGPTFMGNPLACAVSNAALDLIDTGYWKASVPRIEAELADGLLPLRTHNSVRDVRVRGAIGVVEMEEDIDMAKATALLLEHNVWLRPFGRLLYTMPPFISTTSDISAICRAMTAVVEAT